jgi:membrane protein
MGFIKSIWSILREAGLAWIKAKATRLSAALAFYTLLSVAPLFIIATAIAGAVFGERAATGALTEELRGVVGNAGAEVTTMIVDHANRAKQGIMATIIGIITMLFGASGVFNALHDALNTIWEVNPKSSGSGIWALVRERFLAFAMVLVIGFLLLASVILNTILSASNAYLTRLIPEVPVLDQFNHLLLSFLFSTVLFALILKILPDVKVFWRDVWLGAAITSALFTAGNYLIGIYLSRGTVASPFGAAGSLVAFLVWVYYSGLIVLFGAALTKVTAQQADRMALPAASAKPDTP